MKWIKKKKTLFFLFLLLFLVGIGGTFAYYYREISISNRFKTMTYDVVIEEEFDGDWGEKKVSFSNHEKGSTPVVLRMNYNESWRKNIGDTRLSLDNNVNGENVVEKTWTEAFNNDFIKKEDGWYYYKKVLNAEESVQVLSSITLKESLIATSPYYDEYKTYTYELAFNFEAIQANSNAIKEIWGKTTTINEGNIEWES